MTTIRLFERCRSWASRLVWFAVLAGLAFGLGLLLGECLFGGG